MEVAHRSCIGAVVFNSSFAATAQEFACMVDPCAFCVACAIGDIIVFGVGTTTIE